MSIKSIIIAFFISIFAPFFQSNERESINYINELSYSYSTGWGINDSVNYHIVCNNNCVIKIKESGKSEKETVKKNLTTKQTDELIKILRDNYIEAWDGFNKSDKNVLDGNSFSFHLKYNDDEYVSASGYMMWPDHYHDFKKEFEEIFR